MRKERITVRLRPLERRLLEEAAHWHGETTSAFARTAALQAARRVLGGRWEVRARPPFLDIGAVLRDRGASQ